MREGCFDGAFEPRPVTDRAIARPGERSNVTITVCTARITAVAQRDVLRRPRKNPNIRNGPGQLLPHAARRLDRDHVEAPVAQLPGELPGARRKIKNPARARREQPVDRLRRVGRAAPLVGIRR